MCGEEPMVRIERAHNGFIVDAYTPGDRDKPGEHRRQVATSAHHALSLARPHLAKVGKKRGKSSHKIKAPKASKMPQAMKRA